MKDRIIPLTVVVILGILVGVTLSVQRAKVPSSEDYLAAILQTLKGMQAKVDSGADNGNLQDINQRLAVLEAEQNTMQMFMKVMLDAQPSAMGRGNLPAGAPLQPPVAAPQARRADTPNEVYDIEIAQSPVRGNQGASVTIVEFVDFQCPFCGRFHPPLEDVLKTYPNEVKYILKNFPLSFHPQARPAAKAALAAGEQGKYYEMADLLLENGNQLSEEKFKELAGKIGLDVDKFIADYKEKDAQWEKIIEADMALGGRINVGGTPTFFLNGRNTNARDVNSWKTEIEKILKEK